MWQVNTVIFHRSEKQHNFLSLLAASWGCQANNEGLAISGGKGSENAHLQDVRECVWLASTLATHLNNSVIATMVTAQLPGSHGFRHHCAFIYPLASSPPVVFKKGLWRGHSTAAAPPMLPLLAAAGGRRCFSPFPADTQYLVWFFSEVVVLQLQPA